MRTRLLTLRFPEPLRDLRRRDASPPAGDWDKRLREAEEAAYARGRREGEEVLREQLLQQRADLHALEQGLLRSLRQAVPQVARETEQALTHLALEVARRLVAGLPISAEMVEAAVREALAQVEQAAEFHVSLHPEDLELLRRVDSALLRPEASGAPVHFHAAPEISRGGCLVKTRFGLIDARRETKWEQIQKAVGA